MWSYKAASLLLSGEAGLLGGKGKKREEVAEVAGTNYPSLTSFAVDHDVSFSVRRTDFVNRPSLHQATPSSS